MAKKDSEVKVEDKSECVSREEFNNLAAKVRRMSDNWKSFCAIHLGSVAKDGKVGSSRIAVLLAMATVLTMVSLVSARMADIETDRAHWDTAVIREDGSFQTQGSINVQGTLVVTGATTVSSVSGNGSGLTNLNGANIASGNIGVNRLTNGAASLGPSIGGNIPVAAITNAAGSVGPSIGGNIPSAAITNVINPLFALYVPLTSLTNAIPPLTTNDCLATVAGPTNRVVFNAYGVKISSTQL